MEIKYTIARLVQCHPFISVAGGDKAVGIGEEEQILTLVLMCADGCRVKVGDSNIA